MNKKSAIAVALMLTGLTACNDSDTNTADNGGAESSSYSVTAIDGYLRGAQVWLDLNGNFKLDIGEPSANTGNGGKADLDTTGIDNPEQYSVIVQAIKGETVDEDTITDENPNGTAVEKAYVMSAPPGESAVTPISTLVHIKVKQSLTGGESAEEIKKKVSQAVKETADQLGISEDKLLGDFKQKGHNDVAFAARNIISAQVLPESPDSLQVVVETPEKIQQFIKQTESINSLIKDAIKEVIEEGGSLSDLAEKDPVITPPEPGVERTDMDGDGVWDDIDAYPYNPNLSKKVEGWAYDSFFGGQSVMASTENKGTVDISSGTYTGKTNGEFVWFYTPFPQELVDAGYLLSAVPDFKFEVNKDSQAFNGDSNIFANIYVTPKDEAAYQRILTATVGTSGGAPLRDTNWNKDKPEEDTYVITALHGQTLNEVMQSVGASKSDFKLLSFIDAPRSEDGDPEAVNTNFILKLGDSKYQGSENFTLDSYSFNPTFKIGSGPELVIGDAVNLVQNEETGTVTGESYGKRIFAYVPMGLKEKDYSEIAPLSKYKDFVFESAAKGSFVNIYVVAKNKADENSLITIADNTSGGTFRHVSWGKAYQPDGKEIFAINMTQANPSLMQSLTNSGLDIDNFKVIAFVDGGQDGDPAGKGNFFFKNGGNSSTVHELALSKFEY